jgi:hypothetical protein
MTKMLSKTIIAMVVGMVGVSAFAKNRGDRDPELVKYANEVAALASSRDKRLLEVIRNVETGDMKDGTARLAHNADNSRLGPWMISKGEFDAFMVLHGPKVEYPPKIWTFELASYDGNLAIEAFWYIKCHKVCMDPKMTEMERAKILALAHHYGVIKADDPDKYWDKVKAVFDELDKKDAAAAAAQAAIFEDKKAGALRK